MGLERRGEELEVFYLHVVVVVGVVGYEKTILCGVDVA